MAFSSRYGCVEADEVEPKGRNKASRVKVNRGYVSKKYAPTRQGARGTRYPLDVENWYVRVDAMTGAKSMHAREAIVIERRIKRLLEPTKSHERRRERDAKRPTFEDEVEWEDDDERDWFEWEEEQRRWDLYWTDPNRLYAYLDMI